MKNKKTIESKVLILGDLVCSLQRKVHGDYNLAVIVSSIEEIKTQLKAIEREVRGDLDRSLLIEAYDVEE